MIVKRLLTDWKRQANKDLKGVPYKQISEGTGINVQVIKNYMTLSGQDQFNPDTIEKINAYRREYKEKAASLTTPS